jgi:inhibitor of cysteine peptidase
VSRALRGTLTGLALATLLVEAAGCARPKVYGENVSTIEAKAGEDLVIALPSNPTTGYSWMVTGKADPGVVSLMGSDFETSSQNAAGVAGHQRFTFRAGGRGRTTIKFDYRRPWESSDPAKSASFEIVVR